MKSLPLVFVFLAFVLILAVSRRNRRRLADADAHRQEQIAVGSEVMTTSGLYGRVVSIGTDGTASVSIAPGVDVKWSVAALRTPEELPDRFRPQSGERGAPEELPAKDLPPKE